MLVYVPLLFFFYCSLVLSLEKEKKKKKSNRASINKLFKKIIKNEKQT